MPRRVGRLRVGPTARKPADSDDPRSPGRPRRRCAEEEEAAAEAAGAGNRPAGLGASSRPPPTSRLRSRRPATSSRSTGRRRSPTPSAPRAPASAGTTARTSSRRSARRSSPSRTAPSSRSAGTTSAAYAVAARPPGQRVLLRAPLRVLAARGQRARGRGRRCARLRRQHGRRGAHAVPPALRDPSRRVAAHGLRRRGQLLPVPDRLAAARGRRDSGRARLGAAVAPPTRRRRGRRVLLQVDGHLERERPRARVARAGARRRPVSAEPRRRPEAVAERWSTASDGLVYGWLASRRVAPELSASRCPCTCRPSSRR